jgi:hypothetical protein
MVHDKEQMLPSLPLDEWRSTKNTLHLWLQIVGKIRLALSPPQNHWWHVTLYVTPRGLTTGPIPYGYGDFTIDFDFVDHMLVLATSDGRRRGFALADGLSVSAFYDGLAAELAALAIDVSIRPVPYDTFSTEPFPTDSRNASYDREYIERFRRIHVAVDGTFQRFRGRFAGKSTPVHVFWHSFDLALTRFSGKRAPVREGAGRVEREAYSHECISFGFWTGDDRMPAAAFYSYTAPEPAGLADEPLAPAAARWSPAGAGVLAVLPYDDVRRERFPQESVLEFLESAYRAGAKRAGWDRQALDFRPPA